MKSARIWKKHYSKRKRTELIKTVLIFALSAILCIQAILIFKSRSLDNIFFNDSDSDIILNNADVTNLYFEYTAPEYIMVNRNGSRDVFYSDNEYYILAQQLLQEINRNVFMPDVKPAFAQDGLFDKLTELDSVYISYPSRRYPKYAAQFINNSSETLSPLVSFYTKVILVPETAEEKNYITVYIKDDKTGKAVKVPTLVASDELIKYMDKIKGLNKKEYSFAHELNLNVQNTKEETLPAPETELKGDILIPHKNLSLPQVSVISPVEFNQNPSDFGTSPAAEEVMSAFGFNTTDSRQYYDNSGVLVCVDEKATLKLFPGGVIEYNSVNQQSGLNLTGSSRLSPDNSYILSFTGISRIINSVIPLAGNTERSFKIRLTELQSESVEVSEYKFMFDYYINGIRILNSPYHGIEATAVDGKLISMRIDLKRFESSYTETTTEELVSAIDKFYLERKGSSPVVISNAYLAYPVQQDSESITPQWMIY